MRVRFGDSTKKSSNHRLLYDTKFYLADNFEFSILDPKGEVSNIPIRYTGPEKIVIRSEIYKRDFMFYVYKDTTSKQPRFFVERYIIEKPEGLDHLKLDKLVLKGKRPVAHYLFQKY